MFLEGQRIAAAISVFVPCLAVHEGGLCSQCNDCSLIVSKWCTHKPVPLKTAAYLGSTLPMALRHTHRKMLITIAVNATTMEQGNGVHPPGNLLVLEEKNRRMLAF